MEACELVHLTPGHWDAIRPIYEDSFPDAERIPTAEMESLISAGDRSGWVVNAAAGEAAALAITIELREFVFLEYLATDERRRSHGLGSALMDQLVEQVAQSGRRALVWEIESTTVRTDSKDQKLRRRRAAFYERCGGRPCEALGERFVTPGFDGSDLELELWEHTHGQPPLSRAEVGSAATEILRTSYGLTERDELLVANLARLDSH